MLNARVRFAVESAVSQPYQVVRGMVHVIAKVIVFVIRFLQTLTAANTWTEPHA